MVVGFPCCRFADRELGGGIRVTVKFLTEFSSTPALAVLAFAFGKTRTSLRASNPKITLNLKDGIWPQVALLTCGARGPASPSSPFALAGAARTQTRIWLWLSNPDAA